MTANKNYEQEGYDAWIELWIQYEYSPTAGQCPARYMQEGAKRSAYLKGWIKAKKEYEAQQNGSKDHGTKY